MVYIVIGICLFFILLFKINQKTKYWSGGSDSMFGGSHHYGYDESDNDFDGGDD